MDALQHGGRANWRAARLTADRIALEQGSAPLAEASYVSGPIDLNDVLGTDADALAAAGAESGVVA